MKYKETNLKTLNESMLKIYQLILDLIEILPTIVLIKET